LLRSGASRQAPRDFSHSVRADSRDRKKVGSKQNPHHLDFGCQLPHTFGTLQPLLEAENLDQAIPCDGPNVAVLVRQRLLQGEDRRRAADLR
jgi:hypothetical protein